MPGTSPIDGAASTMNMPPGIGGGIGGGMPMGAPGGMSLGKAAKRGHRKHGHSLHHGPHKRHGAKGKAGHKVSQRKGR